MFADHQLLRPDFDDQGYLRHTLQLPSFDTEQRRIARCIDQADQELETAIAENASRLVDNVSKLNDASKTVTTVERSVGSAQAALSRLRHVIHEPYLQIEGGVAELRNTTAALELVRAVSKYLGLVHKINEAGMSDTARVARLLREVEDLLASCDITGIDVVDAALPTVSKASATVRSRAIELLRSSMSHGNLGDMGLAVQCFASLGTLHKGVAEAVAERKRDALTVILKQLSVSALSGEGDAALAKIDGALQTVAEHANTLADLWKVLRRKDLATQRTFFELLSATPPPTTAAAKGGAHYADPQTMLSEFWKAVSEHLSDHLQRLAKKGALHAMLVAEFARFHRILTAFLGNLRDFFAVLSGENRDSPALASFLRNKTEQWLRSAIQEFERRFHQGIQERQKERVAALVARLQASCPAANSNESVDIAVDPKSAGLGVHTTVPTVANSLDGPAQALTKAIQRDLAANRPDEHALRGVLDATGSTLKTVSNRMREYASRAPLPDLPSVAVSVTTTHLFRISMCNAAAHIVSEIQSALALLPRSTLSAASASTGAVGGAGLLLGRPSGSPTTVGAADGLVVGWGDCMGVIRGALSDLEALCIASSTPFFDSAAVALSKHVDTLFPDDGFVELKAKDSAPSRAAHGSSSQLLQQQQHTSAWRQTSYGRSAQVDKRLWHFLTRFGLLFERSCPGLDDRKQRVAQAIVARFVAQTLTCTPADGDASTTALANDLELLREVVSNIFSADRLGALSRVLAHVPRVLNAKAAKDIPTPESASAWGRRGSPVALLLACVLRLDRTRRAVELPTAARTSRAELLTIATAALREGHVKQCARLWEAASRSCFAEVELDETTEEPEATESALAASTEPPGSTASSQRPSAAEAEEPAGQPNTADGLPATAKGIEDSAVDQPPAQRRRVPTVAAALKLVVQGLEEDLVPR